MLSNTKIKSVNHSAAYTHKPNSNPNNNLSQADDAQKRAKGSTRGCIFYANILLYCVRFVYPPPFASTLHSHAVDTQWQIAFPSATALSLQPNLKQSKTNVTIHLILSQKQIKEEINFACFVFYGSCFLVVFCVRAPKPRTQSKVESSLLLALFFIKSTVCLMPYVYVIRFDWKFNSNLVCNQIEFLRRFFFSVCAPFFERARKTRDYQHENLWRVSDFQYILNFWFSFFGELCFLCCCADEIVSLLVSIRIAFASRRLFCC